jgi:hypothetical protein
VDRVWYVQNGGSEAIGPVTTEQVIDGVRRGRVTGAAYICPVGASEWVPLATHPDFAKVMREVAPPPRNVQPTSGPWAASPVSRRAAHKQRMFIVVAAVIGVVSCFLPWVNAPIVGAISGTQGTDGWIVLGLFGLAAGLSLLGERAQPLATGPGVVAGALGAIAAGVGLWKIIAFHEKMKDLGADNAFAKALSSTVSVGVGLYLVVAAGVAIPIIVTRGAPQAKIKTAASLAGSGALMILAVAASAAIGEAGQKEDATPSTTSSRTGRTDVPRHAAPEEVLEFGKPTVKAHRRTIEVLVEATNVTDHDVNMCSVKATFKNGDEILGTAIGNVSDLKSSATKTVNLMGMDDVNGYDSLKVETDTCF